MLKVNDHTKCPECNARSRVIWVSQDGTRAAVQCQRHHSQLVRGESMLGSADRHQTKPQKNMVFLVENGKPAAATAKE